MIDHEEKHRTNDALQQQRHEYPHRVEPVLGRLPAFRGKLALVVTLLKAESAGDASP